MVCLFSGSGLFWIPHLHNFAILIKRLKIDSFCMNQSSIAQSIFSVSIDCAQQSWILRIVQNYSEFWRWKPDLVNPEDSSKPTSRDPLKPNNTDLTEFSAKVELTYTSLNFADETK